MSGWIWLAISFVAWALFHSITAAQPVKRWVRRWLGVRAYVGFYRFAYNVVALLSFLPVLYVLALLVPATVIWRIRSPWAWLMAGVQVTGLIGLTASLIYTDIFSFLGLRQVWRYLQGAPEPDPPVPFTSRGPYALVRHPLYLFSLLALWWSPLLTANMLAFNLLATLYFWIGARHEEQRLAAEFGEQYRRYQAQVPFLSPWPRPSRGATSAR